MSEIYLVKNVKKDYGSFVRILEYKEPKVFICPSCHTKQKTKDFKISYSSLARTKQTIKDIVLCNNFEIFATFTFNKVKINRFDYNECLSAMLRWFRHQKERTSPDLIYLVVPEQHKNGAWHFHALIGNLKSPLIPSGIFKNGRMIFNIKSYTLGFSTAVQIDNQKSVSNYVTKYVTKSLCEEYNRRKFFASQGLNRPIKKVNSSDLRKLRKSFPLACQPVCETSDAFIYIIPSDLTSAETM